MKGNDSLIKNYTLLKLTCLQAVQCNRQILSGDNIQTHQKHKLKLKFINGKHFTNNNGACAFCENCGLSAALLKAFNKL